MVEFDYDGVIPSDDRTSLSSVLTHPIYVAIVDTEGNVSAYTTFVLFSEALERVSKISGDNQHGLPNTELPAPFVVQVRDLNDGSVRHGVPVTFTVTAGGGTLNVKRTTTNYNGKAISWLTLGPNLGANAVEVSAAGRTVMFNAVAGDPVDIPDAKLRAAIKTKLRVTSNAPISPADIATLSTLLVREGNIHDLTGLEHATNMAVLYLGGNNISDISPLAGLTNLLKLELAGNTIVDISPVAGLTSLTSLHFAGSRIADISPVAGLKRLEYLHLGGNNISDLSVLADLTNLTWLGLWDNRISDLSPLASLTNLTYLYLVDNNISDLSPLVVHTGLGNGDEVDVRGNPLSYQSIHTHIPELQSRGVTVEFDNRTPAPLLNISGVITASNNVLIVVARDNNGRVLEGVPVTFTVTSGGGTLSVTSTITDGKGRAQSTLTLGSDGDTNIVRASVEGISESVTFSDVQANIPDSNLRTAIEEALGKKEGVPIAPGEMAALTRLEVPNANISNLTGLEFATNLTRLELGVEYVEAERRWLNSNSVSNLSPLAELTKLTELSVRNNDISDISPLVGLTNLTRLWSDNNNITDISPVVGLANLTYLNLGGNNITDISPVAGLTNLTNLALANNGITDISAVVKLTHLTELHLGWNKISDLSPLIANTGLGDGDRVVVTHNPLSYQSIHTHIPTLQSRGVTVEFDNRAHPALLKISGDNQNGASLVRLSQPFIVEAQDANGSALGGIPVRFAVVAGGGTLNTTITRTDENGRAQSTLILGPNLGANTVEVSATGIESPATFYAIADTELPPTIADVNNDGSVNVLDLILITADLDTKGSNLAADVNRDGVVSILDLVLVAGMFDSAAAAPSAQPQVPETLTAVEVQGWLTDARALEGRDAIMQRGIIVFEQLLVSLTPTETELLANYPNPFNPET